jgi:hypothetical protein
VPLLLVVRSRHGQAHAPCRYARETTTGSGAESTCPSPRAVPIRARNHHWKWCGVDVPKPTRRADTHAKPPLEVVAPVLAVDSDTSCSGFALALAERAARALNRATATAFHGCHYFQ